MAKRLQNRVAIVSGAGSSGTGRGSRQKVAAHGFHELSLCEQSSRQLCGFGARGATEVQIAVVLVQKARDLPP
jgi:NAD(P)-dependent dehydrogenase (short-subunit alcohol dehydrogenase family)